MSIRIWHFHQGWKSDMGSAPTPANGFYEESYVGKVLDLGEHNWHDDSDFYAVVWDDEASKPKHVDYATTRGWTYNNGANVDADSSVRAKYNAYLAKQNTAQWLMKANEAAAEAHSGAKVVVAKGRKFAKGKTGEVFGAKHCTFANYHGKTYKVWVKWDDGSGADMVDVKNLTVTKMSADHAANVAKAAAASEQASAAFAALLN